MKIIWGKSPITAAEVIEQLQREDDWHPKTAKTLLNRLVKKGALKFKRQGRAYLYEPTCKESECLKAAGEGFMQRCFGGSIVALAEHFLTTSKISAAEIRELRKLVN